MSVAYSILAITRCVEWLLSAGSMERISEAADWRAALVINAIAVDATVSFKSATEVLFWDVGAGIAYF
jgi:hypothetical protein